MPSLLTHQNGIFGVVIHKLNVHIFYIHQLSPPIALPGGKGSLLFLAVFFFGGKDEVRQAT